MELDFSGLTDDQLLQLLQGAMTEAVTRGAAIARASESIYDDAALELQLRKAAEAKALEEKRRKEEEAIKRNTEIDAERAKQERNWQLKTAAVLALKEDELFSEDKDFSLNIWSRGPDVRVYLQDVRRKPEWEIVYYHTGNSWNAPGSIEGLKDEDVGRMRRYFELLCKDWSGLKTSLSEVAGRKPCPTKLKQYKDALEEKQDV